MPRKCLQGQQRNLRVHQERRWTAGFWISLRGECIIFLEDPSRWNPLVAPAQQRVLGTGRELTTREAIEMLKMCEEEGLVHCVENKYGLGHVICNCDNVACGNWGHDRAYLKKFTAPSRFKAGVDPDLCTACETCGERCFFDAVSMTGPDDTAVINADKCMGCGICVPTCPGDAITYEEVRPVQSIPT